MGAMNTVDPIPNARLMLSCFVLGVVFIGICRAVNYYPHSVNFRRFYAWQQQYVTDEIGWGELTQRLSKVPWCIRSGEVPAWISGVSFLAGVGIAYADLFI